MDKELQKRSANGNIGSPTSSSDLSRAERLLEAVRLSAEACGVQLSAGAALLFVNDLQGFPDDRIADALAKCRAELKPINGFNRFTVADVMDRLGVPTGEAAKDAEALASWERISDYFQRYIVRNEDTYCERHYFGQSNYRSIILTEKDNRALRFIGGWTRFGNSWYSPGESISFLRKDYLSAYKRVDDAEYQDALPSADLKGLMGNIAEWPK